MIAFVLNLLRGLGARAITIMVAIVLTLALEGAALWYVYHLGKGASHVEQLQNSVTVERKVRDAGTRARGNDTSGSLRDGSF